MSTSKPGEDKGAGEKKPAKRTGFKLFKGGDQISGQVGDENQNVIIGKNNLQIVIGTLKIPVLPIVILIVLIVAAGAYYFLSRRGPAVMTGSFNLAVADFGQLDPAGQVASSQKGSLISQRLYEGLKIELDNLAPAEQANFHPQVWQDSLDVTQKSVAIGIIPGATALTRWTAACALAKTIHANIVIYGNLPADADSEFVPEFAICDDVSLRVNEDEIVGSHSLIQGLSSQLIAQMGRPDTDLAVNLKINSWTNSLSLFSIGILYDLQGQSELALGVFNQARDQLKSGSEPASEVLWFFIGREELTLAAAPGSAAAGQDPSRTAHLANAEAAFKQSASINPKYARAFIGLGGVYFDRAQATASTERMNGSDLLAAIQAYQQALGLAPNSPGALLDTKARLGLVSAWILQGETERDTQQLPAAESSFGRAIVAATAAIQPLIEAKQYRLLAQAYLSLGEAYHEQGHLKLVEGDTAASKALFAQASQNYGLCIQQKGSAITDQTLADTIVNGFCVPYKQSVDASLAQLK